MSKVITFSMKFPSYHKRKGEQTFFVEKLLNWYSMQEENPYYKLSEMLEDLNGEKIEHEGFDMKPFIRSLYKIKDHTFKLHTIRSGNRWKVGDECSPRVWSGMPYKSKQITILPDLEIKKIYKFEIRKRKNHGTGIFINKKQISPDTVIEVANNDGLTISDFMAWFKYPCLFKGQIICFGDVKY